MSASTYNIASWRSPKVEIRASAVAGKGLFALEKIAKNELIAVKGGHIVQEDIFRALPDACKHAALQVSETMYLVPLSEQEVERIMVYINHSCEPNVGLRGHLETIAFRDIEPGEELTGDYCIAYSNAFFEFECQCGTPSCRGKVTSNDWQNPVLQKKYQGYFCQYLENKMQEQRRNN